MWGSCFGWWRWTQGRAGIVSVPDGTRPGLRILILSGEKRNQNYYRDVALLRHAGGAMVTDAFDFRATGWDVPRVAETALDGQKPDLVFVSYHHGFTNRFQGLDRLRVPKIGFVGDSYDFLGEDAKRAEKAAWFRAANFDALLSVYPHTDEMVRTGLGRCQIPILHSAWAVDAGIFAPQGRRRRYDIASLGAHTAGKYPFRIAVREYLESQDELRFFSRQRMPGGHDGPRFARTLNRLRSCFTCASVYRFTVMKYFEIPACGTLLFAEPTDATAALGFRDGENFVAVTPSDFRGKFHYYLRQAPDEAVARISQAGRQLIETRHTWDVRATELLTLFRQVL
jgi:Glycosyl transferases group 1